MHDSAQPTGRYSVCSLFAGVVVAAVALSPAAYADGDLFTPTGPSIVVGGTVHPPTTIVVDPTTPAASTGPTNPPPPVGVDPRVRVPPPVCCTRFGGVTQPRWPGSGPNPVFSIEERDQDNRRTFLDNHGRYWGLGPRDLGIRAGRWMARAAEAAGDGRAEISRPTPSGKALSTSSSATHSSAHLFDEPNKLGSREAEGPEGLTDPALLRAGG
jgi:hypothetical protein